MVTCDCALLHSHALRSIEKAQQLLELHSQERAGGDETCIRACMKPPCLVARLCNVNGLAHGLLGALDVLRSTAGRECYRDAPIAIY